MTTVTSTMYALRMNYGSRTHKFATLEDALDVAEMLGYHSHYECDDGRVFIYRDDEERDADVDGGGEHGAIVPVVETDEIECC